MPVKVEKIYTVITHGQGYVATIPRWWLFMNDILPGARLQYRLGKDYELIIRPVPGHLKYTKHGKEGGDGKDRRSDEV